MRDLAGRAGGTHVARNRVTRRSMGTRWNDADDEDGDGVLPPNFYVWLLVGLAVTWVALVVLTYVQRH